MSKIPMYLKIIQPLLNTLKKLKRAVVHSITKIFAAPIKKKSPAKVSAPKKVIKVIKEKKKPEAKSTPKPKKITTGKKPTVSKTNK
jgi:hypothetical protein